MTIPTQYPTLFPTYLAWAWVLTLDVLGSFHLGFCHPQLYNCIPTTLQRDVQMAFCFPLDKLAQDPYDVATWHLFLLLP
jgi:hypothetical protein